MGGGGSKAAGGGTVPSPFPLTNFQDKLLQPPDDDSVRQTWIILRSAIDAHARRFYHCDRVCQSRELVRESLRAAGVVGAATADAAQEAEDLSTLLHSPRHRRLGLRICIVRVMVASIDLCGHPDDTSLEPAVVELMRKFESLRPAAAAAAAAASSSSSAAGSGSDEKSPPPPTGPGKEEEAALAAWRMITAFFLQPAAQELRAGRQPCVDALEKVLLIFARRPDDDRDARLAGLVCVAGRAIELGEKIFCHAARWRFEWKPPPEELEEKKMAEEGGRRSIVVFPALLRSDEEGTKERGGIKYIIIKRKAVSAGSFFDVPVPVRQMQDNSSSSSSGSDSETPDEAPARGRRRRSRRN
ncbi:hypothetical protein RB594_004061 [Gaeumannomyces avenae]